MSHKYLSYLSVCTVASGLTLSAWAQAQPAAGQEQPAAGQPAATQGQETAAQPAAGQPAGQPQWTDRAEYELAVEQISKEPDATKKVQLLDQWTQKYPNSPFKQARNEAYLMAYRDLKNYPKVVEYGREMVKADPKNLTALYWLTAIPPSLPDTSETALAEGEKSANDLLAALGSAPNVTPEQKTATEAVARKTLLWSALGRKEPKQIEQRYKELLQATPNDANVAYALAGHVMAQKTIERYPEAMFYIARAVNVTGPGELAGNVKPQAQAYLEKVYTNYHGSKEGIEQVYAAAKASPTMPPDFKIVSKVDIINQKNQENERIAKENPALVIFMNMKEGLSQQGDAYFADMKGKEIAGMRGRLVSATPEARPTTLVIGVTDPNASEVTLKMASPLPGSAPLGTELTFAGVAQSYTKEPFMLTMEAEPSNIQGWPRSAAAPKRTAPAKRPRRR